MTELKKFSGTGQEISRLLKNRVTPGEASAALQRLLDLRLVTKDQATGRLRATYDRVTTRDDIVNEGARKYHKTSIEASAQAVFKAYNEHSPSVHTARRAISKSEMALELEIKNKIPLPTISFSGITVSYSDGYYGTRPDLYTHNNLSQSFTNVNFDISAALTMTIPILGSGGLFGLRNVEQARINLEQNELRLRDTQTRERVQIFQSIQNIKQIENIVNNNILLMTGSISTLNNIIKQSKDKLLSRVDLKDAIYQARTSEIAVSESILNHINSKIQLAQILGIEYLPREP